MSRPPGRARKIRRAIDVTVEHSATGTRVLAARDTGELPPMPSPPMADPCYACPCCLSWLQSLELLRFSIVHHRHPIPPRKPCPLGPDCLVCQTGAHW